MKNKILLICSALLINASVAADFKFGYVDVAKIFTTSKPATVMKNHLTSKFAPQQQELKKMGDNLAAAQKEMQAIAKKAPSIDKLATADRARLEKMEAQYQKNQIAFQQKYMQFQQTAQKIQDVASALVLDKTNSILKDISDKGGYDLVLTSQQLVFAKAKYNLTDQVIEQLNAVNSADMLKQLEKAEKQAAQMPAPGQVPGGSAPMQAPIAPPPAAAPAK